MVKTINLSLLKYFFQKENNIANKSLFDGLKIVNSPYFELHQGLYPVIFMTFKGIKVRTYENAEEQLKQLIADEFGKHLYLLSSPHLN